MIEKIYKNKCMVICDNCGTGQECDNWANAIDFINEECWKKLTDGERKYYCLECTEFNKCQHDKKIINAFINGEWCDTNDICRLLKISFADGLKCFDFLRVAEWNVAPLEGQKITTKFRIKQMKEGSV